MVTTTVAVLVPQRLLCGAASPYRRAAEAALREAAGASKDVAWRWVEPTAAAGSLGRAAAEAQAQAVLREEAGVDLVLVPGLEPPYQAQYYTRVFRGGQQGKGEDRAEPIVHATTLRLAPYERAYLAAVALCRHFGWRHVALLGSDDHHMQSAQGLRQQLTAAGIHIRRHQVFSPSPSSSIDGDEPPSPPPSSSSSSGGSSTVAHDLDAIRSSGARVVFLLSACGATHEVLSTARRKGMLKDYAWVVLHPSASCSLALPDGGGDGGESGGSLGSGAMDLDILETYQGVLGLAWNAPGGNHGGESGGGGNKKRSRALLEAAAGGVSSRDTPLPPAVAEGLAGFCGGSEAAPVGAAAVATVLDDPLDPSPRFLYEALRHVASASPSAYCRQRSSAAGTDKEEEEGLDLHHDVDVLVLSFSGARRVNGTTAHAQEGRRRRRLTAAAQIEVIYQPVARLGGGELELLSTRPIRWPGDVRTQPRDLVDDAAAAWGGGGTAATARRGTGRHPHPHQGLGVLHPLGPGGLGPLVFLVAAVCIALTPLWNWLFKQLRGRAQPPCMEGACGSLPPLGELVSDPASAEEAKAFIAGRMAELTEKQAEVLRSVEVDMEGVATMSGVGQGSFSVVYKGYYQNSHVAIKVLRKVDERNFRRFLEEILLHKDLRHPNVVMFRGASWADGRLLMLVDYAGRGTLADVLRRSQGTLKWRLVKLHMALGVAKGMAFLHQTRYYDMWTSSYKRCIVHRDLKPQNILCSDSYLCQITDFGEARTVDHDNTMTQVGTQLYVAPEVVRGERYSEKVDVYSFAVVLLAMLELRPDVLDVFAEALPSVERSETGITEERLREPADVEVTDACKTCPLNKQYVAPEGQTLAQRHRAQAEQQCPLAKHKEFKGVVAHAVTRAVVYDDLRPPVNNCPYPALRALIHKCWEPEPAERPSFAAIVHAIDTAVRKEVVEYTRPLPSAGGGPYFFPGGPTGAVVAGAGDLMVRGRPPSASSSLSAGARGASGRHSHSSQQQQQQQQLQQQQQPQHHHGNGGGSSVGPAAAAIKSTTSSTSNNNT